MRTVAGIALVSALLVGSIDQGRLLASPSRAVAGILSAPSAGSPARLQAAFRTLPLSFEANRGQVDHRVKFLSRGGGYTFFLTSTDAVLATFAPSRRTRIVPGPLNPGKLESSALPRQSVVRFRPVGGTAHPQLVGLDMLPGKVNYFIGNNRRRWQVDIPTYGSVAYRSVYPRIDLVYYGTQGRLECDWVLRPGANPRAIRLRIEGAGRLRLDREGNLVLGGRLGTLVQSKPLIYQQTGRTRQIIAGRYTLIGPHAVGFNVASYDVTRPLIIDPVLLYSTYLGGSGSDHSSGIALDGAGEAYITGSTDSSNFPVVNALQPTPGGGNCTNGSGGASPCTDAFIAELSPAGNSLIYSTYLGGPGNNSGNAVALDSAGNAYVAGSTSSTGFPVKNALQSSSAGAVDAFIAKIGESPATPTPTATPAPTATSTSTPTPTATPKSLHVAVSGTLRANHSGTLRVTVSDPPPGMHGSDGPVAGATIRLDARSVGIKKVLMMRTSARGVATFRNVHPRRAGVATLKVSKTGFPSVAVPVKVRP